MWGLSPNISSLENIVDPGRSSRGGSRISGKGVIHKKVWGFALLILSHFS